MNTALVIIDMQLAIDDPQWGMRNNPDAEDKAQLLLVKWRKEKRPVFHVRHDSRSQNSPYRPNQPLHAFKDQVKPIDGEEIIAKSTNNAFVDTAFERLLRKNKVSKLVICGVLTQHSVDCTARMASSLGFETIVVADATAATAVTNATGKSWCADDVHELALTHLRADYAEVVKADDLLLTIPLQH